MPLGSVLPAWQSEHDPLVLEFCMVSGIHQDFKAVSGGVEVVVNPGSRLVAELLDGIDLQDDLAKANEVGCRAFVQRPTHGMKPQGRRRHERNPTLLNSISRHSW